MKESRPLMKFISAGGRERTVGWLRSGVILGLLVPLMNAQAAVIDDVKTTVDTINSTTKTINTKVTSIKSQTNLIAPMKTTVGDVQDSLQDLPSTVQATIGVNIDPEMKEKILEVVDIFRATLDQQAIDLENFGDGSPGTGCYEFRNSMKALARDSVDTMFLLRSIGGSTIPEIPSDEIETIVDLIDVLNCKLFLPAWLALTKTPIEEIIEPLSKTRDALSIIMPLFDITEIDLSSPQTQTAQFLASGEGQAAGLTELITPISCRNIESNRHKISAAALYIKATSVTFLASSAHINPDVFAITGPIVNPAFVFGRQMAGVHGYANLEMKKKSPPQNVKLAFFVKALGEMLGALADWASSKVDICIDVENQNRLYQNQVVILAEICELSRFRSEACKALPE